MDFAEIEARSTIEEIDRIVAFIDAWCEAQALSDELRFKLHLVAEEFSMNAIMHGYRDREDGWIHIRLVAKPDALSLIFQDEAPLFDPLVEAATPDVTASVEERQVGGLGVHLVKEMTRFVGYRRDGQRNVLTADFDR
ncbi:MAG: ATP-binding protein [Phreatobacter sp.]|uniref:ATP-binding protein n=1 Tax=Phreatobacter sp. TaxID=1966341 RepID=UPI0027337530|nr:ATP-binding protein [Phreatobacter sp.]MDP2801255.1 ATP-binding protein [Phreatobacter sp.]